MTKFTVSLAWSVAFMIATWLALILFQSVIIARFETLSASLAEIHSLSWILLGIIGLSGVVGLVLSGLGKLPGTR